MYALEIYRNKKYRTVYVGRESQVYKRLPSIYSRARIKYNGEVIRKIN